MTVTHTPGLPTVEHGLLISTNPATGEEVARVPIAGPDDVAAAVDRAGAAAAWWAGLGFAGRRTRLLRLRSTLANRMPEIADLLRRECGKPVVDGVIETAAFISHIAWAAGNARRVLGLRRVRGSMLVREFARSKSITARRAPSLLPVSTFERDPAATARRVMAVVRPVHGRSGLPQPSSSAGRFRR